MDSVHLVQKTVLGKNEFTLEKDGIHARQKKNGQKWEFTMPYEYIGFDTVRKKDNQMKYTLYISVPIALAMIIGLVTYFATRRSAPIELFSIATGAVLFSIFAAMAWAGRKIEYIYLQVGQKRIEMFSNVPDEQTVQNFIEQVYNRIRAKHREDFFRQPTTVPLEIRIKQLNGLVAIKAITEAERDEYLEKTINRNASLN